MKMKHSTGRRAKVTVEKDAEESYKGMKHYVEELLQKKSLTRENALTSVARGLTFYFESEHEFLRTNFATILYRCLNLFKNDSAKELQLASQAIGLLAMTVESQDNEHEIYREVVPQLLEALKSGPKTSKVFQCLAITTFFGSTQSDETEKAMQILWDFIQSDSNSSSEDLLAAISAWLFLVASLDGWRFSYNYWQGAVSYFLNLLENDDPLLSLVAAEGLALIFETRALDKFCLREETSSTPTAYSYMEKSFRGVILEKMCLGRKLLSDQNAAYKIKMQYLLVFDYFMFGSRSEICEPIHRDTLVLSSWSQEIQWNYLKSFLGVEGFYIHMKGNRKIQEVFEFSPRKIYRPVENLYIPTVEEITIRCFLQKDRHFTHLTKEKSKTRKNAIKHVFDKAITELKNKNRKLAEERKQTWLLND